MSKVYLNAPLLHSTIVAWVIILAFLTGCTPGKFSINRDKTKLDWPKSQKKESANPLIYNQEALIQQLKGKTQEEVIKVLGNPAVETPYKKSEQNLEY